ncbi:hypothetical protein TOPH_02452, partial [Tolypocladium ophioglossoides CBS 100239]
QTDRPTDRGRCLLITSTIRPPAATCSPSLFLSVLWSPYNQQASYSSRFCLSSRRVCVVSFNFAAFLDIPIISAPLHSFSPTYLEARSIVTMVPNHFFTRLPPAAALLVVSTLLRLTAGHVLPRETRTIQVRALSAEPWPLAVATPAPTSPPKLRRRGQYNTICGYIGGDPALPATCVAGSHCAVDVKHGAVGCCPDGDECTGGIFTGCVDKNSGPQTVKDPYVFTCVGKDVCYKNTFDGGYFQYGCASASSLATSVATTASGRTPLQYSQLTLSLTATPTPLSSPTTIGSPTSSDSKSDSEPGSSTLASPSASAADGALAPNKGNSTANTGAIVGGTVGGLAFLVALVTLGFFLWRRRKGNTRRGPGPNQNTEYISPMADARHNFEALPSSHEVSESRLPQHLPRAYTNADGISLESSDGDVGTARQSHHVYDGAPPEGAMRTRGGDLDVDPDRVPLTREIDDFSQGFNSALQGIQDDDSTQPNSDNMGAYPGPRRGSGGILWQQNRRQARNLMWM